jgi:hypothetical protein
MEGGSYPSQVSWSIESGDSMTEAYPYSIALQPISFDVGDYTLHMLDSFGDGWNSAVWSLIASGTGDAGNGAGDADGNNPQRQLKESPSGANKRARILLSLSAGQIIVAGPYGFSEGSTCSSTQSFAIAAGGTVTTGSEDGAYPTPPPTDSGGPPSSGTYVEEEEVGEDDLEEATNATPGTRTEVINIDISIGGPMIANPDRVADTIAILDAKNFTDTFGATLKDAGVLLGVDHLSQWKAASIPQVGTAAVEGQKQVREGATHEKQSRWSTDLGPVGVVAGVLISALVGVGSLRHRIMTGRYANTAHIFSPSNAVEQQQQDLLTTSATASAL